MGCRIECFYLVRSSLFHSDSMPAAFSTYQCHYYFQKVMRLSIHSINYVGMHVTFADSYLALCLDQATHLTQEAFGRLLAFVLSEAIQLCTLFRILHLILHLFIQLLVQSSTSSIQLFFATYTMHCFFSSLPVTVGLPTIIPEFAFLDAWQPLLQAVFAFL